MSDASPSRSGDDSTSNTSNGTGSDWDWESCDTPREGIVHGTGGTKLFLVVSGAPRRAAAPVVIFEAGLGASSGCWVAVQRLLNKHIRSYRYDRAGYGRSPASMSARSAANMAAELHDILRVARVSPPYILVAHSYGGIIAREFVAAAGAEAIAAMVLIETNQEMTHPQLRVPFATIKALCGDQNYLEIIGLSRENGYTPQELAALIQDEMVTTASSTASSEGALILNSSMALGEKRQLTTQPMGMRPITVIRGDSKRDFGRLLDAAAQADNRVISKQVAEMNDFVENRLDIFDRDLQMQQLCLSGNSRFVQATKSGHSVMATEPELVADEIFHIWAGIN